MNTLNSRRSSDLPSWLNSPVWLAVFLSPTMYVLLLVIIAQSQIAVPPVGLVVFLFCVIPVVALIACGTTVWRSQMILPWRVTALVLTVLAMLLQCGLWFAIIIAAITAAIAPG